jgi:non-homologous end joining protein Ku
MSWLRPERTASRNTMPRALKNRDISLGLATILVQLFTATSSQGVAFHLLHERCGSRIQMRLECPIVAREETVRGTRSPRTSMCA